MSIDEPMPRHSCKSSTCIRTWEISPQAEPCTAGHNEFGLYMTLPYLKISELPPTSTDWAPGQSTHRSSGPPGRRFLALSFDRNGRSQLRERRNCRIKGEINSQVLRSPVKRTSLANFPINGLQDLQQMPVDQRLSERVALTMPRVLLLPAPLL